MSNAKSHGAEPATGFFPGLESLRSICVSLVAGRLATAPKVVAEHGTLHNVPLATGHLLTIGYVITLLAVSWLTYWLVENPGRLMGRRLASSLARS